MDVTISFTNATASHLIDGGRFWQINDRPRILPVVRSLILYYENDFRLIRLTRFLKWAVVKIRDTPGSSLFH